MLGDLQQDRIPEWEYPIREVWGEFDPIWRGRVPEWIFAPESSDQRAAGWQRLPPFLRAIAWREREIAAFLYNRVARAGDQSERLPQLKGIGVVSLRAFRRFGNVLAGALFVSPPFDSYPDDVYRELRLAPTVEIETRIYPLESYGLERETPIVVLQAQPFMLYGAPTITLQSGMAIEGNHAGNQYVRGALTAIAEENGQPVLVGAYHVFGAPGQTVTANGQSIAQVTQTVPALDAAIAEPLDHTMPLNDTIAALGGRPGKPVLPCTGVPVQYEGARSQRQQAHTIDIAYYAAPPIPSSPIPTGSPLFSATIPAAPGDSGALLTTQQSNVPQRYLRQNPQLAALYDGAMIGMLIAGPDPPAPGPQTILFCPILDIGDQLSLDWLTT